MPVWIFLENIVEYGCLGTGSCSIDPTIRINTYERTSGNTVHTLKIEIPFNKHDIPVRAFHFFVWA